MKSLESYLRSRGINIRDFEKVIISYRRKYFRNTATDTDEEILSQKIESMSAPYDWVVGAFGWESKAAIRLSREWLSIHYGWHEYIKDNGEKVTWHSKAILKPIKNIIKGLK